MATPQPNPVSPEQVLEFAGYMKTWQKRLNLSDWRIVRSPKRSTAMAEITKRHLSDRLVSYRVGNHFGAEVVNAETLEETAIHELGHVFLHELVELARDQSTAADVLMSAEHRVINTLTPLLMQLAIFLRKETP